MPTQQEAAHILGGASFGALASVNRQSAEWARLDRINRGRHDIDWFATYYFPTDFSSATPPFHHTLDRLVAEAEGDRAMPGTIIAAPRGSAKTTRLAFLRVIWSLLYRRHRFVVVASKTQGQAEERVQKVRFELEINERLRADFGDLCGVNYRPVQTWQQNDIILCWPRKDEHGKVVRDRAGHPMVGYTARLYGVGTGVAVRGLTKPKRPDLILGDDLENDDHVATALQREKTWAWWSKVIVPMADPRGGTLVVVGTILHYDSLLARLLKQEDERGEKVYHTAMFRAVEPDGTYLWPEVLSPQYLEGAKRRMGTHAYNQEYLNNPLNSDTQVFRPEWWRWYTKSEVRYDEMADAWTYRGERLRVFMACDPAIGQKDADDEFVAMVVGVTADSKIFVLDMWYGHLDFPAQVRRLKDMILDWMPDAVGIETNAYQEALRTQLAREIVAPIRRLPHHTDKMRRITAISPYVENGQVYLRASEDDEPGQTDPGGQIAVRLHAKTAPLYEQATQYPASAKDDRIDCFAMCLETSRTRRWFEDEGGHKESGPHG